MPRNGSGVASKPAGTTAVANTVIESAKYNSTIDDIYQLLNDALPVVAGGTGATTAAAARTNLGFAADAGNFGKQGASIASASTTDLSTATGDYVTITGTTTITSFGTATAGVERTVVFAAALTLTHNATSLILPGAANITTAAGDSARLKSEGSGNWRCVSYNRASGIPIAQSSPTTGEFLRGYLNGLTLSNNATDATNDIDIATGSAGSDGTTPVLMTLASALTKRLDAAWAVGTGNGGLDTGTIANTTYHVWIIQRSDTGVVDALFSTSATSPTMPTSYDRKRRIGAIIREGGAIVAFTQIGDTFLRTTPATDRSSTSAQASTLLSLSVPSGVVVQPILNLTQSHSSAGGIATQVSSAGGTLFTITQTAAASEVSVGYVAGGVFTNTSRQIQFAVVVASGTLGANELVTRGWIDTRGK